MKNIIGDRGEHIFSVLISEKVNNSYLFKPSFLGEKWPTIDFYVELINTQNNLPFFCLFQIKSTSKNYTKKAHKLKVHFSLNDLQRLSAFHAPTYIVGIDESNKLGYFLSANNTFNSPINNLPTTFPLDVNNLLLLWQEVIAFWSNSHISTFKSQFMSQF
ncbi:MAG: DUF4365 domain-containing protein [Bacteroidota bacterium]